MKIMFVCTGNIFRSLSAEKIFNKKTKEKGLLMQAVSYGTQGTNRKVSKIVIDELKKRGISIKGHKSKKLTKENLIGIDTIITMAKEHQDFLDKEFGIKTPLFDEIALGTPSSVYDVTDVIEKPSKQRKEREDT